MLGKPDGWDSERRFYFQAFYHFVPWGKSFTELHDRQMQVWQKEHNDDEPPDWYVRATIPGSFVRTYMASLATIPDVPGWAFALEEIYRSYTLRTEHSLAKGDR